jgi:hypothetical protein
MRSVLDKRVQKSQTLHPESEMQRLGGLLRIHVDGKFHADVLLRMKNLKDEYGLEREFNENYASYEEVWSSFNIRTE